MLKSFLELIKKRALFNPGEKVLLAISGGVDSMVLWELMSKSGMAYSVAHCNFQLRGTESDADELLVKNRALDLGITYHIKKCDTKSYATSHKISTQMAAREMRYEWFTSLCRTSGYSKIVLGHHANDDVETFLLNMVRGTSIKGQKGMSFESDLLVRPLLNFSKTEVLSFAKIQEIEWRDDASNLETHYKRNYVRREIVPRLEELNPDLLQTMKRNMQKNQEVYDLTQRTLNNLKTQLIRSSDNRFTIEKKALDELSIGPYMLSELLSDFGYSFAQSEDILKVMKGLSGKIFNSITHRLIVDRTHIIIQANTEIVEITDESFIHLNDHEINHPAHYNLSYIVNHEHVELDRSSSNVMLDLDKLIFPLKIRKWEIGDRFKPLGMKGSKLVSDLLIDMKVSLLDKESVYVLESNREIVWVMGHRVSNDFKVTKATKRLMHFSLVKD